MKNLKRRDFIKVSGLSLAGLYTNKLSKAFGKVKKMEKRPSILFITTDYQRGVDLPSHGSPFLKMPNVDRLCKEGAVFINHISNSPICMPARSCWVTGQYPHNHGLWDNDNKDWNHTGPTLMQHLRDLGYYGIGVGKMHFRPESRYDRLEGLHRRINCESRDGSPPDDDYELFLKEHGWDRPRIKKFHGKYNIKPGNAVYDWPIDEKFYFDSFIGNKAVEVIEKGDIDDKKPWFFWLSFCGPHNPWTAPKRLTEPYRKMQDLPLGESRDGELMDKPIDYTRHRYCYGESMWDVYDFLAPDKQKDLQRRVRAGHYGTLTLMDEKIGQVLKALKSKGLLENTIIVYTSDHGSSLFDNGLLHKGTHFDESVRVPFIMHWPGKVKPGVRQGFSTHVDLLPTLVSLAGGEVPANAEGFDLTEMLKDPAKKVQDFAVMECTLTTAIITSKWRMSINHFNGDCDLYDIENDPRSFNNLADKPQYAEVKKELTEKLIKWRQNLSPEMSIPDDPYKWRDCLGPADYVKDFRKRYLREYARLAKLDPAIRPGRVGKHMQQFLDSPAKT